MAASGERRGLSRAIQGDRIILERHPAHIPRADEVQNASLARFGREEEPPGPSCAEPEGGAWSRKAPSQSRQLSKLPSFISLRSPSTSPAEEERKPERDKPREEAGISMRVAGWAPGRIREEEATGVQSPKRG
ncbi:UNVERIFIED_CONTAM: hypothetical protein K2H54_004317 [Gekko kuhli]